MSDDGGSHVPGLILVFTMAVLPFGLASRSYVGIGICFAIIAVCVVVASLALRAARRSRRRRPEDEEAEDAIDWTDGL